MVTYLEETNLDATYPSYDLSQFPLTACSISTFFYAFAITGLLAKFFYLSFADLFPETFDAFFSSFSYSLETCRAKFRVTFPFQITACYFRVLAFHLI